MYLSRKETPRSASSAASSLLSSSAALESPALSAFLSCCVTARFIATNESSSAKSSRAGVIFSPAILSVKRWLSGSKILFGYFVSKSSILWSRAYLVVSPQLYSARGGYVDYSAAQRRQPGTSAAQPGHSGRHQSLVRPVTSRLVGNRYFGRLQSFCRHGVAERGVGRGDNRVKYPPASPDNTLSLSCSNSWEAVRLYRVRSRDGKLPHGCLRKRKRAARTLFSSEQKIKAQRTPPI